MTQTSSWNPETFIQLTDFREVEEVLRRGRDFVLGGTKAESDEFVHGTLVATDGREHMARRRTLMRMFGPGQPWGAEGKLLDQIFADHLQHVRATVPSVDGQIEVDLIDFCRRVMWRFIAGMVGIDGIDDDDKVTPFIGMVTPVLHGLSVEYLPEDQRGPVVAAAHDSSEQIREVLFLPSLERRRVLLENAQAEGRDVNDLPADLLTSLLASLDGETDLEPIFREMVALLAGSVNNPVSQVAWGVDELTKWLADHPEDKTKLGERDFLNKVVKETLRLHRSSRPYLVRIAVDDTTLESSGRTISGGSWVASWLGAANQDKDVFGADSDRFNPYREPLDPKVAPFGVAFGGGPHVCIARPMVLWEQGSEEAQGVQTKLLRMLFAEGVRPDPNGIRDEVGEPGGRRYERFDVLIPAESTVEV